jgi:Predicted RNA-binding protein homologous to eukaryotic snRNP
MAFDGTTIHSLVHEFNNILIGGKISKITQPEKDELLFTIKNQRETYRLLISADAGLPLLYLTDLNKPSPATAPNFCMLLRKHISNGRIVSITQPTLERIVIFEIEHLNELGDVCRKLLIIELMGKHSNIIFTTTEFMIIDSIKHVSANMSSIREVLPARTWFIPDTMKKSSPLTITEEDFYNKIISVPTSLSKAIYTGLTGISPIIAQEICFRANLDADTPANTLNESEQLHIYHTFVRFMQDIIHNHYQPNIIFSGEEPIEFSAIPLSLYANTYASIRFNSTSDILREYYAVKNIISRIRQKSFDLRRVVSNALERNRKKFELQEKQLKDTEKRDKFRLYGEFINAYSYMLSGDEQELIALDYYNDNKEIKISLDSELTASQNSVKYFERYNKLKRTFEAVSELIKSTLEEINHLESIETALDLALKEEDLAQIKEELIEYGYIKRKNTGNNKRIKITSKPFHYVSSDGFDIYVGKNNYQNDELTFKFANGSDWWFHAKNVPGSHVIVKSIGTDLPDKTFEEAAAIAAYYSNCRNNDKVEVDYIERKHVKKPNKAKPGFVIYNTNYSMSVTPKLLT